MSADRRSGARRPSPRPVAGHVARKRFGQHFLCDRAILAAILEAIDPRPDDALLEIGPGQGSLHMELRRRVGGPIDAVERSQPFARRLRSLGQG